MDNLSEKNEKKLQAKWYIITSITGNEDVVYKNIEDKVRAYKLEEVVQEMRLLKSKEITVEVFGGIDNPPPKRMISSKTITWETLPGNRYKKTRIREINRFPGYIYIKMIMMPDAWYIIRNTYGVTGFVGSSGKGAQPIPMSDEEVENLFDPKNNPDIIINKGDDINTHVEVTIDKPVESEKKIEFLATSDDATFDSDGFFDSSLSKNSASKKFEIFEESKPEAEIDFTPLDYLENHEQILEQKIIDLNKEETKKEESNELFKDSNANNKKYLDFSVGNTVEILANSWEGHEGEIVSLDPKNNNVVVAIEMLGRINNITLSIDEIKKKA